jgi:hypothetical protein
MHVSEKMQVTALQQVAMEKCKASNAIMLIAKHGCYTASVQPLFAGCHMCIQQRT